MKRFVIFLFLGICAACFGQNAGQTYKVEINITNVLPDGGAIVVSIHNSEASFKNRVPVETIRVNTTNSGFATVQVTLAGGDYAFSIYQDTSSDGELNTNLIGIPKEPFGFSNYEGKNPPGNFKKHKVFINADTSITIPLVQL